MALESLCLLFRPIERLTYFRGIAEDKILDLLNRLPQVFLKISQSRIFSSNFMPVRIILLLNEAIIIIKGSCTKL